MEVAACKKKIRIHVIVDEELFKQVDNVSRELDCPKSTIMVQALRWWLRGRGNRRRFIDNGEAPVEE